MSEQRFNTRRVAVLIVDPNPISRRALSTLLGEGDDIRVIGDAASPDGLDPSAVRAADVAILGEFERGPGAIIEQIRESSGSIKVVVMAHFDGGEIPFQAIQHGADGLVPISAGAKEIREAIHEVTETGTAIDADLAVEALHWAARREEKPDPTVHAPRLTARETQILEYLAEGRTAAAIASRLGLSRRTVEAHLANAYRKLGVHGRFEALARVRAMSAVGSE